MAMNVSKLSGVALATAVAGIFALTSAGAAFAAGSGDQAQVKCEHSNACKGQGACKSAQNSCKGHNACKGQGFTMQKDEAACKAAQEAVEAKS